MTQYNTRTNLFAFSYKSKFMVRKRCKYVQIHNMSMYIHMNGQDGLMDKRGRKEYEALNCLQLLSRASSSAPRTQ